MGNYIAVHHKSTYKPLSTIAHSEIPLAYRRVYCGRLLWLLPQWFLGATAQYFLNGCVVDALGILGYFYGVDFIKVFL